MNVLFAAAEMSPIVKVGGLGDVAGSLPRALRALGHDVRVALPLYGTVDREAYRLERIASDIEVPWRPAAERVGLWRAEVRGVPVYLIEHERMFGRNAVYGFKDDLERFLFFCDALLACAPHLGFAPDVVHAQDWHTALLLTRLSAMRAHPWAGLGRVYTIHNLGLQGKFTRRFADVHGIGARQLRVPGGLPANTAMSAMAQGILHAGRVNTVSETYAREITTKAYGAGLERLLRARLRVLSGIVNGIDYEEFDPAKDKHLIRRFSAQRLSARIEDKRALQRVAGLPVDDSVPLFATVTRLYAQKGIDLVPGASRRLLEAGRAQLVILGNGDGKVHRALLALEARYQEQVKVWLEFNAALGQQIYGGCDVFLMPSRYEPCGLGQLISLRYGAVPLVRRTGGLADTVTDIDAAPAEGTGYVFDGALGDDRLLRAELRGAMERAARAYADRRGWRAMQLRGMRQDWSWGRAAGRYVELYEGVTKTPARARGTRR
ncbi:MAG: glycogen/starch synthase [Dehalococcoidia bacterium]